MARFSDLPNELIIEVWRYMLDPEAFESFALTSKRTYSLCSRFIEEHNDLKARFSTISHCAGDSKIRPAETLRELLLNPRAALYVRSISIDSWRRTWDDSPDSEGPRHRPYSEETMELFRQTVQTSMIGQLEIDPWIDELEAGDEDAVLALIVMRLPNVESFNLLEVTADEMRLSRTIQDITRYRPETLSRLREVKLRRGNDTVSGDLDWVHTFAALPSVKVIEAWSTGHGRDDYDNDCLRDCYGMSKDHLCDRHAVCPNLAFTLPTKISAVTHLTLINCDINTKRLFGVFEGLRALEYFDYLGAPSSVEFCGAQNIVNALLAHNKSSLQTLRLRTCGKYTVGTLNLAEFEVLKELEIESDLLLLYKDGSERSKLVDLLPPSIEKIDLRQFYVNVLHSLAKDVLQMTIDKAERLPKLRELTIQLTPGHIAPDAETVSKMEHTCNDIGVLLGVTIE